MIALTEKQIKEIAEWLDCGFMCYYNKKTGEIRNIMESDDWIDAKEDAWHEEKQAIFAHLDDYVEFSQMESREAFQMMVDFADVLADMPLKEKLYHALNNRKPFANFKWQIDNSGPYRQQWFDFKNQRYIEHVTEQLDNYNIL